MDEEDIADRLIENAEHVIRHWEAQKEVKPWDGFTGLVRVCDDEPFREAGIVRHCVPEASQSPPPQPKPKAPPTPPPSSHDGKGDSGSHPGPRSNTPGGACGDSRPADLTTASSSSQPPIDASKQAVAASNQPSMGLPGQAPSTAAPTPATVSGAAARKQQADHLAAAVAAAQAAAAAAEAAASAARAAAVAQAYAQRQHPSARQQSFDELPTPPSHPVTCLHGGVTRAATSSSHASQPACGAPLPPHATPTTQPGQLSALLPDQAHELPDLGQLLLQPGGMEEAGESSWVAMYAVDSAPLGDHGQPSQSQPSQQSLQLDDSNATETGITAVGHANSTVGSGLSAGQQDSNPTQPSDGGVAIGDLLGPLDGPLTPPAEPSQPCAATSSSSHSTEPPSHSPPHDQPDAGGSQSKESAQCTHASPSLLMHAGHHQPQDPPAHADSHSPPPPTPTAPSALTPAQQASQEPSQPPQPPQTASQQPQPPHAAHPAKQAGPSPHHPPAASKAAVLQQIKHRIVQAALNQARLEEHNDGFWVDDLPAAPTQQVPPRPPRNG